MAKEPEDSLQWRPMLKSHINLSSRKLGIVNRIINNCDVVHRGHTIDGQPSPCWEWLGGDSGKGDGAGRGYGRIRVDNHVSATHRVMFTCFHGYVPPKRDIDHACHNRICCNPDHLKSVTHIQNCKTRRKPK